MLPDRVMHFDRFEITQELIRQDMTPVNSTIAEKQKYYL